MFAQIFHPSDLLLFFRQPGCNSIAGLLVFILVKQSFDCRPSLLGSVEHAWNGNCPFGGFDAMSQQKIADRGVPSVGGGTKERLCVLGHPNLNAFRLCRLLRNSNHFGNSLY